MAEDLFEAAQHYHAQISPRIQHYLNGRGLSDLVIDNFLVGWSGWRITIPITNRDGVVVSFKLAKDPEDVSNTPKMLTTPGAAAELYGWEHLREVPQRLIVCEGEFDRLVLESRGIAAVTSTAGAGTFRVEWADALRSVPQLFICFDRDTAGENGANRVVRLLPNARLVRLPDDVGVGGDVSDFFVRLGRSTEEFEGLLAGAVPAKLTDREPEPRPRRSLWPRDEVVALKGRLRIEEVVAKRLGLRASGPNLSGHCPFHADTHPSFLIYPDTQTFHCFGCQAHGDVLDFLMRVDNLKFPEALDQLRRLAA